MPVRIGVPGEGLGGLSDSVRKPHFATAAGLAIFGAEIIAEQGAGAGFGFGSGAVGKVLGWLREFF